MPDEPKPVPVRYALLNLSGVPVGSDAQDALDVLVGLSQRKEVVQHVLRIELIAHRLHLKLKDIAADATWTANIMY